MHGADTENENTVRPAGLSDAVQLCPCPRLRIVTWNTAGGPREGLRDILEAIGNEEINGIAKPIDVLSLQGQTSVATTTQDIVDILSSINGDETYARGLVNDETSGGGRPGLIYNTTTVSLKQESHSAKLALMQKLDS